MIFKLKFGGGNLFSPAMCTIEENNSGITLGATVEEVCGITLVATVEEGDPRSELKILQRMRPRSE
jgi:hypothetical protein